MSLPVKLAFRNRTRIIRSSADTASACRDIESLVSSTFSVPLDDLRKPSRSSSRIAFARQVAMYLAHVELGLSPSIVGIHFGRDRTTVSHACERVEDWRDDPTLDTALMCLALAIARHQRTLGTLVAR